MKIWWHSQNLNKDRDGDPILRRLLHGRGWLIFGADTVADPSKAILSVEWRVPSSSCGMTATMDTDGDSALALSVRLPPVALYFGVESWPLSRAISDLLAPENLKGYPRSGFARELSVSIHDWAVYWKLWRHPHEGRSRDRLDSAWYPFGFPGAQIGKARVVERREVQVPMPERTYVAQATRSKVTTRGTPHWPFSRPTITTVTLDFGKTPVPVPGKGENSWDCGEDAVYSTSGAHNTIEKSIGAFVASTLETRKRRGGPNWRPETKKTESVGAPS